MMILNLFVFIFFIFFFLIIPAEAFFHILSIKSTDKYLINLGFLLLIGIILITILSIIVAILHLGFWCVWLVPLFSLVYIYFSKRFNDLLCFKVSFSKLPLKTTVITLAILIFGISTQNLVLFQGGWPKGDGLAFPAMHDTMWNLALVGELKNHFPPQHPGLAGEMFRNNHYFYQLFIAVVSFITKISIVDLYYRFAPLTVSLLFGISIYAVSSIFCKKNIFIDLGLFLGYFSGNFAYFVPLFLGNKFDWKGNTFFSDQPFDQIINPYSVLGFSIFLFSIYSLFQTTKDKKVDVGWSIITAILIGSIYGFKSFGGVIVIPALVMTMLIYFIYYKKTSYLILLLLTLLIFIPIFFLITDPNKATLKWVPGWLLTEMMSGQDKLNLPEFVQIESYYKSVNNWLGYSKIKLIEFFIYTIGNLGIRLLGLIYLIQIFISGKKIYQQLSVIKIYILFCVGISFFVPLLFNLRITPYNIVQFTPYSLVVLAILTAAFAEDMYYYLKQKGLFLLGCFFLILLISMAIPVNIKNIIGKIGELQEVVSYGEIEALNYLRDHSERDAVILINPQQYERDPMYISALSERRIYLASSDYAYQTGNDPTIRKNDISEFFSDDWKIDKDIFIKKNNISYIYLLKTDTPEDFINVNKSNIVFNTPFENSKVIIYTIN